MKQRDLVERAVSEILASRVDASAHVPLSTTIENMRAELAPHFQAIWDRKHDREYHRTGRRLGKSHYNIRRLLRGAALTQYSVNPFILPTAKSAVLSIWPLLKRICHRHFPDSKIDETLKTATLACSGAQIVVGGCETVSDVGNWFGMPFATAAIDECGNFPDKVFCLLSDEALEPGLMDHGGEMIHSGNPGRVLRGRWYDETGPSRTDTTPLYTGDARSNPFLKIQAADYFAAVKLRHGWTDDSVTFRRQYLGEWVDDGEGLLFRIGPHNSAGDALPTHNDYYGPLAARQWRFVLGIDVGVASESALAVVAVHPGDRRVFLVHVEKYSRMLIDQMAARIRDLREQYRGLHVILDSGGMGATHVNELGARFGIWCEGAKKGDKLSEISVMRDDIESGRFQLLDGSATDPFRDECTALTWNEDRSGWEDGPPDHAVDAVLYAKRAAKHHVLTSVLPPSSPWLTQEQRWEREATALREAAFARAKEAAEGRFGKGRVRTTY